MNGNNKKWLDYEDNEDDRDFDDFWNNFRNRKFKSKANRRSGR